MGHKMTDESIEWLKANYSKLGRVECAKQLMVHKTTISKYAKLCNLTENNAPVISDSSLRKGYCMDCEHYMPIGQCARTKRYTGALNEKQCFKQK